MKTYFQTKEKSLVDRGWHVVDASGVTLGRLATEIAVLLRGKNKPIFTPHNDCGDFVVVVNAEKIKLTGNKMSTKTYYRHSGFVGGLKSIVVDKLLQKHPERVVQSAVKGMLPKGSLGRSQLLKLKVYAGPEHPHQAQNPETYQLKFVK